MRASFATRAASGIARFWMEPVASSMTLRGASCSSTTMRAPFFDRGRGVARVREVRLAAAANRDHHFLERARLDPRDHAAHLSDELMVRGHPEGRRWSAGSAVPAKILSRSRRRD
jgi:hypothetical protein